ncbi:MAG: formimidoylglutamate deiminase [Myxococcaceae bacterium]|nr:formimidoylglutamate deiminase [Myxococcaceae bacterium]
MKAAVYEPELGTYVDGALRPGARLCVGEDGRIVAAAPPGAEVVKLPGRALFPGLVNAHSHAFQRVLRARTERVANGDDFWAWRELMYRAASTLTPEELHAVSRLAFVEMALAGVTAVGEFHYVHHQPGGQPYADVHELSRAVVRAARDAGLRIVLLRVGYARAGFQAAPNPLQARFIEPDVDTYLSRTLSLRFDDPLATVGLAPHSVRAVPREWLEAIAKVKGLTHIHVAEQPAELVACRAEHGLHPVELLEEVGLLHATAVHAIHLEPEHEKKLTSVCACPSTEANLGDGVVPADVLMGAGVRLSLGSDSQARINLLDEARLLEDNLRLVRRRRAVLDGPQGLGARLFACASENGAKALGLPTGSLKAGAPADFFTLGVDSVNAAIFGQEPVRDVAVQGQLIVRDGQHVLHEEAKRGFEAVVRSLAQ